MKSKEIVVSSFYGGNFSRKGFWTKGLGVVLFWEWDKDIAEQFLDFMTSYEWHDDYAYHWSAAKDYRDNQGDFKDEENIRANSSDI